MLFVLSGLPGVGVRAVDVEIVCSDVDEYRRRVESRSTDIAGHRLPTWTESLSETTVPGAANGS